MKEKTQSQILNEYAEQMQGLVNAIVEQAIAGQLDGQTLIRKNNLHINCSLPISSNLLYKMLEECDEIESVDSYGNDLYIKLSEPYINRKDAVEYINLNEAQIEIICAKHTLWEYDAGGEQANFNNCILKEKDLSFKTLENAVFDNCKLIRVDLPRDFMDLSSFKGMAFYYCDCDIAVSEADFTGAKFFGCKADTVIFDNCNLNDVKFTNCEFGKLSLRNCCIKDIDFGGLDMDRVNLSGCYEDMQEWEDGLSDIKLRQD